MGKRTPTITKREKDFALFFGHNFVRSKKARDVDNGTTRGVTDNFSKMWNDPSRHDWPGIDTKNRIEPLGFSKRKGKKAFDEITRAFGESGF